MKFDNKTDEQIESWARKYEEQGKTADPAYTLLLEERTTRRQKKQKLNFDRSMTHLRDAAIRQKFTSYGRLAEASEVDWSIARHQMNGPHGHLDTLLDICHKDGLPLLTAICVNQQNLVSGKLGEDALAGFADGARRLGIAVDDAEEFHARCAEECFEWGKSQK